MLGDLSAFAVNPLELLRELVERHVIDPVAAHIAEMRRTVLAL